MAITEEHKARMKAGRERARLTRERDKLAAERAALVTQLTAAPSQEAPAKVPPPEEPPIWMTPPPGYVPPQVVMPDPEPPPENPEEPEEPEDEFSRYMKSLNADVREGLTLDEHREIWVAQMAKAEAEKKVARKRAAADRALVFARIAAGITPAQTADELRRARELDEMVTWRVNLPESGGQGHRVDQKIFLHGHMVTTTRAEYESMRGTEDRAWRSEALFNGQKTTYFSEMQGRYQAVDPWSGGTPQGTRSWTVRGQ